MACRVHRCIHVDAIVGWITRTGRMSGSPNWRGLTPSVHERLRGLLTPSTDMLLDIDRSLDLPLAGQIAAQIRRLVMEGDLPPHGVLPSSRELARRLGVDRGTVARAFACLEASGYLELSQGRRARVRTQDGEGVLPLSLGGGAVSRMTKPGVSVAVASAAQFDLRSLSPDPGLLPTKALQHAMRRVFDPDHALGNAQEPVDPRGDPGFLDMLRRHLRRHGIDAGPATLVATSGAQQAFDLLLRVLLKPGAAVAVETPGYASLLSLLRLHGAKVIGIPMGAEGMDLKVLQQVLCAQRLSLVFTMPGFQNPTGVSTSAVHRLALLRLCAEHHVPLVEDGFLDDMKYFGQATPPIKASDTEHQVIYVGTFSKLLWPRLRLGWVVASPELTETLAQLRGTTEFGGFQAAQQAITLLQEQGVLARYTRRAHREYRQRMICLLRACRLHLGPIGARFYVPEGGFVVWVETPLPGRCEPELMARLLLAGVLVQAGSPCHVEPSAWACVRLSMARCDILAIEPALMRIAQTLKEILQKEAAC